MSDDLGIEQNSSSMYVGYGVLMPPSVFNAMRDLELAFQVRYGENPGLHQPPHITVKAPFETSDLEKHKRYLDELGQREGPIEIALMGVSFFEGGVMFLDVAENQRLHDLGGRILRDLAPEATPSPFEASGQVHHHATLAFMRPERLAEARRDFASAASATKLTIDQLGLFLGVGGPNSSEWIVIRIAQLTGRAG